MKMYGPWYTFEETAAMLNVVDSELKYLLQKQQLMPVVYSTERNWLLHRRQKEGWTVYAVCKYRGALKVHPEVITKLLDGEKTFIGQGAGKLLEPENAIFIGKSYPYERPLPHPPIVAWSDESFPREQLLSFLVTPVPNEVISTKYLLAELAEKLNAYQKNPDDKIPTVNAYQNKGSLKKYILNFTSGKPFESTDIRIPKSEIERYKREHDVGPSTIQEGMETSRENALHSVLRRLIKAHPKVRSKRLWNILKADYESEYSAFDQAGIIEAMDDLCIEWLTPKSELKSLKYESFSPTLSRLKKRGN